MDADRFDAPTRSLSAGATRRYALLAALGRALGASPVEEVGAKKKEDTEGRVWHLSVRDHAGRRGHKRNEAIPWRRDVSINSPLPWLVARHDARS